MKLLNTVRRKYTHTHTGTRAHEPLQNQRHSRTDLFTSVLDLSLGSQDDIPQALPLNRLDSLPVDRHLHEHEHIDFTDVRCRKHPAEDKRETDAREATVSSRGKISNHDHDDHDNIRNRELPQTPRIYDARKVLRNVLWASLGCP